MGVCVARGGARGAWLRAARVWGGGAGAGWRRRSAALARGGGGARRDCASGQRCAGLRGVTDGRRLCGHGRVMQVGDGRAGAVPLSPGGDCGRAPRARARPCGASVTRGRPCVLHVAPSPVGCLWVCCRSGVASGFRTKYSLRTRARSQNRGITRFLSKLACSSVDNVRDSDTRAPNRPPETTPTASRGATPAASSPVSFM